LTTFSNTLLSPGGLFVTTAVQTLRIELHGINTGYGARTVRYFLNNALIGEGTWAIASFGIGAAVEICLQVNGTVAVARPFIWGRTRFYTINALNPVA